MAGHKLTADQEDYFDLLCRLAEDYDWPCLDLVDRECVSV